MPIEKTLLKIIALAIFAIFIGAFISYYNKPAAGNAALARNSINDTIGKPKIDSFDTVRVYFPSSKSMILSKEKPLLIPRFKNKKDTVRLMGPDTAMPIKKDTAKIYLQPKQ